MLYLLIPLLVLIVFGGALLLFDDGDRRGDLDPSRLKGSDFPPLSSYPYYFPLGSGIHGEMSKHIEFVLDGLPLREVL
jgi:hypothetical protein